MSSPRLTLSSTLFAIIALLGFLGILVSLVSDGIHRNLALSNHKAAIQKQLDIQIDNILDDLSDLQKEMGIRMQSEAPFRNAQKAGDTKKIKYWFEQEYQRYLVTTELLDLNYISLFNVDFVSIVSTQLDDSPILKNDQCNEWKDIALQRKGADRIKPISGRCLINGGLYQYAVLTTGGLRPTGYLLIVSDPVLNLQQLEKLSGYNIQIKQGGNVHFTSENWNTDTNKKQIVVSTPVFYNGMGINIDALIDLTTFQQAMSSTTNVLLGTSIFLVFVVFYSSLYLIKKAMTPLDSLREAASKVAYGEYQEVEINTNFGDIKAPILSFNRMINNLQEAHETAEKNARLIYDEKQFSEVTLSSLVNGVVVIAVSGQIRYMNSAAEKMTGIQFSEVSSLKANDVLSIFDEITGEKLDHLVQRCLNGEYLLGGNYNLCLISRNNTKLNIELTLSTMRDQLDEVLGVVAVIHDTTETSKLTRQLSHRASHDALTGLINRYEFEVRLKAVVERGVGDHVLCYMDLDQFKVVNDTSGHIAGDELLRQLSGVFQEHVSRRDILARLGGDEFGLLLEDCPLDKAQAIVSRIQKAIANFKFIWEDKNFTIGSSCGLVVIDSMTRSYVDVLSSADSACYIAKNAGGDRSHVYRQDDDELQQMQGDMQWVGKVRTAIEEEKMEIFYQEIIPSNPANNTTHIEVLVRIREGDEYILPGQFIPATERYGIQTLVDRHVVKLTLNWLSSINNPPDVVAINLSGKSISSGEFQTYIEDSIKNSGVDPSRLCFEVTETAAISQLTNARVFIQKITELGCQFALDDFGSGLSSFAYLKYLPVTYLKIDGIFVQNIVNDKMDCAIVKSIIEIGKVMNMYTVAEYVENEPIKQLLIELGVDYMQGFHLGKPQSVKAWNKES